MNHGQRHASRWFGPPVRRPGYGRRRSRPASARAWPRRRSPAGSDGKLVDTCHRIDADAQLAIVTDKDADGLDMIRHSTAHLLAYAVKELFPDAQVTIGPVIENGFYYDFAYKRPFTPEDLAAIEKQMAELAKQDEPVAREVLPRDEAVALLQGMGEQYKAEIIAASPRNEDISLYREGDFIDLCRGPHVPSHRQAQGIQADEGGRRLLARRLEERDAAAHLRHRLGEKEDQDSLPAQLEEAEKRDHRKLGRELDLFHIAGRGAGHGVLAPQGLDASGSRSSSTCARVYRDNGYQEVEGARRSSTRRCGRRSGHWDNYRENMFTTRVGEARATRSSR